LLDAPFIILAIPLNRRATAPITTKIDDANIGNSISKIENAIIAKPRTIFTNLDLLSWGITTPADILSIPKTSNTTERTNKAVNIEELRENKTARDKIMLIPPITIRSILSQGGDSNICKL
jgi:hypothetical protein